MTRLLVLAVAALVAVAVVDGMRTREGARDAPPRTTLAADAPLPAAAQERVAEQLREIDARGALVYSDVERDCRLSAVRLPMLSPEAAPRASSCRFALSPGGHRILFDGGWRADGRLGFPLRRRCRRRQRRRL